MGDRDVVRTREGLGIEDPILGARNRSHQAGEQSDNGWKSVHRDALRIEKKDGVLIQVGHRKQIATRSRQVENGGERSIYLKMCDRIDNLRSLRSQEIGDEFRQKQKIETRDIWMPGPFKVFRHTPMWEEMCELCEYKEE